MAVHDGNGLFRKSQHPKTDAKNTAAAKISESEFDSWAGDRSLGGVLKGARSVFTDLLRYADALVEVMLSQRSQGITIFLGDGIKVELGLFPSLNFRQYRQGKTTSGQSSFFPFSDGEISLLYPYWSGCPYQ